MCRSLARLAGLFALVFHLAAVAAQGPKGDPTAPPKGLEVVFVDVGQGDSTILIGPTGRVLLFDGGPNGAGTGPVLRELKKRRVTRIQMIVASHYHADHVGGLDEVVRSIPADQFWDRGRRDEPTTFTFRDYVRAAGSRRKTVSLGQVFDLGGGARARVLAWDGNVLGRSPLPIRGTRQQENAASVVLRVDYGDFSMWLGGDLTGGGNRTFDVETPVAKVCGDVDVYQADHHGSVTSTNRNLVATLKPEVCILSNGDRNPFGHPHNETINILNTRNDSRVLLDTSAGAGKTGYTVGRTLSLVTDGWRYRIESSLGGAMEFYTDEYAARLPAPGEVVLTEVQRDPSLSLGEYLEIQNRAGSPVSLLGLEVAGNLGTFRIAAPYRVLPGGRLLLFLHGDPARNGSLPFGHCWPFRALSIGNTFDNLRLRAGTTTIDALSYSSGFAGGRGRAAERADVLGASSAGNFKASTNRYGSDFGTPGARNSADTTRYRLTSGIEVLPAAAPGGRAIHLFNAAFSDPLKFDVAGLSLGTFPGVKVGPVRIPLNADPLFFLSVQLPGFVGILPPTGIRAVRLGVPAGVAPLQAFLAHFLLDPLRQPPVPSTSAATKFRFP